MKEKARGGGLQSADFDFLWGRIAGGDRWETAVEISKATFPDGTWSNGDPVQVVTITTGSDFPDALAAGPLAAYAGPILLVPSNRDVPQAVLDEVTRLDPTFIAVVGGTSSVSNASVGQIVGATTSATFQRFAGTNRYETAMKASNENVDGWANVGVTVDTAFVATGQGFADALGGAAAAGYAQASLVLTKSDSLPTATLDALQYIDPAQVYILGGPSTISASVMQSIADQFPSATVTRVAGTNRFDTAAQLADVTPTPYPGMFIANGLKFPDALAAGAVIPYWGEGLYLSKVACLPAPTFDAAMSRQPDYVIGLGGTSTVSDAALQLTPC